MQQTSPLRRIRKPHIAFFLVAAALFSYALSIAGDHSTKVSADVSGIPLAIAKDDRVSGNLEMSVKIDDVQGDNTSTKHKGEIDVDSYAWLVTHPMGASKATMSTFTMTMPESRASARLFLMSTAGLKVSRIVLSVRKAGTDADFVKWTLTDAVISSFKTVGNTHGDGLSDQVDFTFGKIEAEYDPADGSAPIKTGWDQRSGKSVSY